MPLEPNGVDVTRADMTRAEVIRQVVLSARDTGVEDCVLCPPLRFRFNHMVELPGAGGILCGDRDFFVVPDLAPVAEGHLLLVTTAHWTCALPMHSATR